MRQTWHSFGRILACGTAVTVGAMNFGNTGCDSPVAEDIGEQAKQYLETPSDSSAASTPATPSEQAAESTCDALLASMAPLVKDASPGAQCELGKIQLEYINKGCDSHATQQDVEVTTDLIEFFCDLADQQ